MTIERLNPSTLQKALSNEEINPSSIVDYNGNPLKYGNDDPNVIGPDDDPKLSDDIRDRKHYPGYPNDMFEAEKHWILPFAVYLAQNVVGVNLIDELSYKKVQKQLKEQYIFVVLDISNPKVNGDVLSWEGIKIWCKNFPLVVVNFKLNTTSQSIGIGYIKIWEKKTQKHNYVGDPSSLLSREDAANVISNYFAIEKILKKE